MPTGSMAVLQPGHQTPRYAHTFGKESGREKAVKWKEKWKERQNE